MKIPKEITAEDFQDLIISHFGGEGDAPAFCTDDIFELAQKYKEQQISIFIERLKEVLKKEIDFNQIGLFRQLTEYERGRHEQSEHIIEELTKLNNVG